MKSPHLGDHLERFEEMDIVGPTTLLLLVDCVACDDPIPWALPVPTLFVAQGQERCKQIGMKSSPSSSNSRRIGRLLSTFTSGKLWLLQYLPGIKLSLAHFDEVVGV